MDQPEIKFINTKVYQKVEKRQVLFKDLKMGEISLHIMNVNMDREMSYRLLECASIFQEQLPFMPRSYIVSQIFYPDNYILSLVYKQRIVCCLLFRPFLDKNVAEIVFLAALSLYLNKGFGYLCLAAFKEYINKIQGEIKIGEISKKEVENLFNEKNENKTEKFIYTYADFTASAFFAKQQFSKEITNSTYKGLIKDYQGGYLMECVLTPELNYLTLNEKLLEQKNKAFDLLVKENAVIHKYGKLLDFSEVCDEIKKYDVERRPRDEKMQLTNVMKFILSTIRNLPQSWPFIEPVNGSEVPEYYEIIKKPMDLLTMSKKVQQGNYKSLSEFELDFDLIINNCVEFNGLGNIYSKNAVDLNRKFKSVLRGVLGKLKKKLK